MTNEGARRSQKPSRLNISATFCFLRHEKDLSPYSVADPSFFAKYFRRLTGLTPMEYKKQP